MAKMVAAAKVHKAQTHQTTSPDYDSLFTARKSAPLTGDWIEHARTLSLGDDLSRFSFHARRDYARKKRTAEFAPVPRDHVSSTLVGLRYDLQPGGADRFALNADGGIERRRFGIDLADGRWTSSRSVRVSAEWSHDDVIRLSLGYAVSMGSNQRQGLNRSIELAQGAIASRQGARLAIDYSPAGFSHGAPISFGLQAQADRIGVSDSIALGAASRNDRRLSLNMKWHF